MMESVHSIHRGPRAAHTALSLGYLNDGAGELAVQEFWSSKVWPTSAYRRALGPGGRGPDFRKENLANE
jgi:hypothetical protein